MITVDTQSPERLLIGWDSGYYYTVTWDGVIWNLLQVSDSIVLRSDVRTLRTDEYDSGWIHTTPSSAFSRENDCYQYDVEGHGKRILQGSLSLAPADVEGRYYLINEDGTKAFEHRIAFGIFDYEGQTIPYNKISSTKTAGSSSKKTERHLVFKSVTLNSFNTKTGRCVGTVKYRGYKEVWNRKVQPNVLISSEEADGEVTFRFNSNHSNIRRVSIMINEKDNVRPLTPSFAWYEPPDSTFLKYLRWYAGQECAFGDLSSRAAESIRLTNINSLAYGKDMLELGSLAKQLASISEVGRFRTVGAALKTASGVYLASHYGLRLTIKDTERIAEAIDKVDLIHPYQRMGASDVSFLDYPGRDYAIIRCESRCNAIVDSFTQSQQDYEHAFKRAGRALYEYDLVPSLANLWDMVPWSFVADWFAPLGDAFDKLEIKHYAQTLNVRKACYSRKFTWAYTDRFTTGAVSYEIPLKFKYYYRHVQKYLVTPTLRVDSPAQGLPSHWLEAAALTITNL